MELLGLLSLVAISDLKETKEAILVLEYFTRSIATHKCSEICTNVVAVVLDDIAFLRL